MKEELIFEMGEKHYHHFNDCISAKKYRNKAADYLRKTLVLAPEFEFPRIKLKNMGLDGDKDGTSSALVKKEKVCIFGTKDCQAVHNNARYRLIKAIEKMGFILEGETDFYKLPSDFSNYIDFASLLKSNYSTGKVTLFLTGGLWECCVRDVFEQAINLVLIDGVKLELVLVLEAIESINNYGFDSYLSIIKRFQVNAVIVFCLGFLRIISDPQKKNVVSVYLYRDVEQFRNCFKKDRREIFSSSPLLQEIKSKSGKSTLLLSDEHKNLFYWMRERRDGPFVVVNFDNHGDTAFFGLDVYNNNWLKAALDRKLVQHIIQIYPYWNKGCEDAVARQDVQLIFDNDILAVKNKLLGKEITSPVIVTIDYDYFACTRKPAYQPRDFSEIDTAINGVIEFIHSLKNLNVHLYAININRSFGINDLFENYISEYFGRYIEYRLKQRLFEDGFCEIYLDTHSHWQIGWKVPSGMMSIVWGTNSLNDHKFVEMRILETVGYGEDSAEYIEFVYYHRPGLLWETLLKLFENENFNIGRLSKNMHPEFLANLIQCLLVDSRFSKENIVRLWESLSQEHKVWVPILINPKARFKLSGLIDLNAERERVLHYGALYKWWEKTGSNSSSSVVSKVNVQSSSSGLLNKERICIFRTNSYKTVSALIGTVDKSVCTSSALNDNCFPLMFDENDFQLWQRSLNYIISFLNRQYQGQVNKANASSFFKEYFTGFKKKTGKGLHWPSSPESIILISKVLKEINLDASITNLFDLGSGNGFFCVMAAHLLGINVVGYEFDESLYKLSLLGQEQYLTLEERARIREGQIKFKQGNFLEAPLEDYNLVYHYYGGCGTHRTDLMEAFVAERLNKGACFAMFMPDYYPWRLLKAKFSCRFFSINSGFSQVKVGVIFKNGDFSSSAIDGGREEIFGDYGGSFVEWEEAVIFLNSRNFNCSSITAPDGAEIKYLEGGNIDGPVAVFLHGFLVGDPLKDWACQIRSLYEDGFRIVCVSWRGYNGSALGTASPQAKVLVNDLLLVFEKLNIEKAFVFGHSMGAALSMCFAALKPRLVKALVLSAVSDNFLHSLYPKSLKKFYYLFEKYFLGAIKVLDNASRSNQNSLKAYLMLLNFADTVYREGILNSKLSGSIVKKVSGRIAQLFNPIPEKFFDDLFLRVKQTPISTIIWDILMIRDMDLDKAGSVFDGNIISKIVCPVFWMGGTRDPMVVFDCQMRVVEKLENNGIMVCGFVDFYRGHEVHMLGGYTKLLREFLAEVENGDVVSSSAVTRSSSVNLGEMAAERIALDLRQDLSIRSNTARKIAEFINGLVQIINSLRKENGCAIEIESIDFDEPAFIHDLSLLIYLKQAYGFDIVKLLNSEETNFVFPVAGNRWDSLKFKLKDYGPDFRVTACKQASLKYALAERNNYKARDVKIVNNLGNFLIKTHHFVLWAICGLNEEEVKIWEKYSRGLSEYYSSIGFFVNGELARRHGLRKLSAAIIPDIYLERFERLPKSLWRTWSQIEADRFLHLTKTISQNKLNRACSRYHHDFRGKPNEYFWQVSPDTAAKAIILRASSSLMLENFGKEKIRNFVVGVEPQERFIYQILATNKARWEKSSSGIAVEVLVVTDFVPLRRDIMQYFDSFDYFLNDQGRLIEIKRSFVGDKDAALSLLRNRKFVVIIVDCELQGNQSLELVENIEKRGMLIRTLLMGFDEAFCNNINRSVVHVDFINKLKGYRDFRDKLILKLDLIASSAIKENIKASSVIHRTVNFLKLLSAFFMNFIGISVPAKWAFAYLKEIVDYRKSLIPLGGTVLICIDGKKAVGKTTISNALLRDDYKVMVLHLDDFIVQYRNDYKQICEIVNWYALRDKVILILKEDQPEVLIVEGFKALYLEEHLIRSGREFDIKVRICASKNTRLMNLAARGVTDPRSIQLSMCLAHTYVFSPEYDLEINNSSWCRINLGTKISIINNGNGSSPISKKTMPPQGLLVNQENKFFKELVQELKEDLTIDDYLLSQLENFLNQLVEVLNRYHYNGKSSSFHKALSGLSVVDIADLFYLKFVFRFDILNLLNNHKAAFEKNDSRNNLDVNLKLAVNDLYFGSIDAEGYLCNGMIKVYGHVSHSEYSVKYYDKNGRNAKGHNVGNFLIKVHQFLLWVIYNSQREAVLMDADPFGGLEDFYRSIGFSVSGIQALRVGCHRVNAALISEYEKQLFLILPPVFSIIWRNWPQRKMDRFLRKIKGMDLRILQAGVESFLKLHEFDEDEDLWQISPDDVVSFVSKYTNERSSSAVSNSRNEPKNHKLSAMSFLSFIYGVRLDGSRQCADGLCCFFPYHNDFREYSLEIAGGLEKKYADGRCLNKDLILAHMDDITSLESLCGDEILPQDLFVFLYKTFACRAMAVVLDMDASGRLIWLSHCCLHNDYKPQICKDYPCCSWAGGVCYYDDLVIGKRRGLILVNTAALVVLDENTFRLREGGVFCIFKAMNFLNGQIDRYSLRLDLKAFEISGQFVLLQIPKENMISSFSNKGEAYYYSIKGSSALSKEINGVTLLKDCLRQLSLPAKLSSDLYLRLKDGIKDRRLIEFIVFILSSKYSKQSKINNCYSKIKSLDDKISKEAAPEECILAMFWYVKLVELEGHSRFMKLVFNLWAGDGQIKSRRDCLADQLSYSAFTLYQYLCLQLDKDAKYEESFRLLNYIYRFSGEQNSASGKLVPVFWLFYELNSHLDPAWVLGESREILRGNYPSKLKDAGKQAILKVSEFSKVISERGPPKEEMVLMLTNPQDNASASSAVNKVYFSDSSIPSLGCSERFLARFGEDRVLPLFFGKRNSGGKICTDGFCCFSCYQSPEIANIVSKAYGYEKHHGTGVILLRLDEIASLEEAFGQELLLNDIVNFVCKTFPCRALSISIDVDSDGKLHWISQCMIYDKIRPRICKEYPNNFGNNGICSYHEFLSGRRKLLILINYSALEVHSDKPGVRLTQNAESFLERAIEDHAIKLRFPAFKLEGEFLFLSPYRDSEVALGGDVSSAVKEIFKSSNLLTLKYLTWNDFELFIYNLKENLSCAIAHNLPLVFVIGHKNPDMDAVISALAEGYRRQLLDNSKAYIPVVQGEGIPLEIRHVLGEDLSRAIIFSESEFYKQALITGQVRWILVDHNYNSEVQDQVVAIIDHHHFSAGSSRQEQEIYIDPQIGSTIALIVGKFYSLGFELDQKLARVFYAAAVMDCNNRQPARMTKDEQSIMNKLQKTSKVENSEDMFADLMGYLLKAEARDYRDGVLVLKAKGVFSNSGKVLRPGLFRELLFWAKKNN
ncbi:MAG: alpha/beta fold hydrolase [Candidatus Omnitrophica bacterium]|nr:alpha/beta fold hydrolase [Candidatus Omnitrophota bacterium]